MLRRAVQAFTIAVFAAAVFAPAASAALPDVTVTAAQGETSAVVEYTVPAQWTCLPASGSTFAVGNTAVSCTDLPSADFDAFQVHVLEADTTPPVIMGAGDLNVNASSSAGAVVTYDLPTVADDRAGVGTPICLPASGSVFPVGLTAVNCTVHDAAGNSASKIYRSVTVNALEDPFAVNDLAAFSSGIGTFFTPNRATLLRTGLRVPISCSANCSVSLTLQSVRRVKRGAKYFPTYTRIGSGSANFTSAARLKGVYAKLTPSQSKYMKARVAKLSTRLVITIKHPGAATKIAYRTLSL